MIYLCKGIQNRKYSPPLQNLSKNLRALTEITLNCFNIHENVSLRDHNRNSAEKCLI